MWTVGNTLIEQKIFGKFGQLRATGAWSVATLFFGLIESGMLCMNARYNLSGNLLMMTFGTSDYMFTT